MDRQMTNEELQNALRTMFKNESMHRVILSALEITKRDRLSFKERRLLFKVERMVNKIK